MYIFAPQIWTLVPILRYYLLYAVTTTSAGSRVFGVFECLQYDFSPLKHPLQSTSTVGASV